MKKTAEITRFLLFGRQPGARRFRAVLTLLPVPLLLLRPPLGALAGCGLFLLIAAGMMLLAAGVRNRHHRIGLLLTALATTGALLLFFSRRDRLGAIGIGLWVILLGAGLLPELRRKGVASQERILSILEAVLPLLLGATFFASAGGSFGLAVPFYALSLVILALRQW